MDDSGCFARDSIASLLRAGRVDRAIALVLRTKRRAQPPPGSHTDCDTRGTESDSSTHAVQSFPGEDSLLTSLVEDFVHHMRDERNASNASRLANAIGTWQDMREGRLPDAARHLLAEWLFRVGDCPKPMTNMICSWLVSDPSLDSATWQRYTEPHSQDHVNTIVAGTVAHLAASAEYQQEALLLFDLHFPSASRTEELPSFIVSCWDTLTDVCRMIHFDAVPTAHLGVVQALRHVLQQWPAWTLVRDTITGLAWWVAGEFSGKSRPLIPLFYLFRALCEDRGDGDRIGTEARGHITSALLGTFPQ